MAKKDEIKEEIWNIWQILSLAKECYLYSYYLHKPHTESELEFLNQSNDLLFIRHILWRNTIIELSKLFKDSENNDKYNIHRFIKKLKPCGHYRSLKVSEEKITGWLAEIDQNQDLISMVTNLRDKIYSHSDANREKHAQIDISFENLQKLFKLVESIIHEIYTSILDSIPIFDSINFNPSKFDMIKVLAKNRQDFSKE